MKRRNTTGAAKASTTEATTEVATTEKPSGFDISPVMAEFGKVEAVENQPSSGTRVTRLKFYWPSNADADEARDAIADINKGHPYLNVDGVIHDAIGMSYLILGTPFYYTAVDGEDFKPARVWLEEQEFGKTHNGKRLQARANAMLLMLPGPDGEFAEDLAPAQVAVTVAKGAKAPAISAHYSALLDVADGGGKVLAFGKKNPSHLKLPEAFRLASTFRVSVVPGTHGTYAKIRAIPKPITEVQFTAVQAFFADGDCQDAREAVEESYAASLAELNGLV